MTYEFKYTNEISFVRRIHFIHLMVEKFPDRKAFLYRTNYPIWQWTAHSMSILHCSPDVPSPYITEKYSLDVMRKE